MSTSFRRVLARLGALAILSTRIVVMVEAGELPAAADHGAGLLQLLSSRYPDIKFEAVHPSAELPGWFEVETDKQLIYTDATGDRLFVGYAVDSKTHEDLTAKRWAELTRVDFARLPLERAIKIVKGDGSRVLAAFEDPLCPYCQKLEEQLAQVPNLTLYVFLLPLEPLHPGATVKAHQIWCATDRAAAWTDWMVRHADPGMAACSDDPIAANLKLADQLRIAATPTVLFGDGSRVASALSRDEIEQRLTQSNATRKVTAAADAGNSAPR